MLSWVTPNSLSNEPRYTIDEPSKAPDGKTPLLRTVWIVESDEPLRFITAYPLSWNQMTTIREHDRVVLTVDVPGEKLAAGDVGTVVHIYGEGRAYEVEFVSRDGETIAIVTLERSRSGRLNVARSLTRAA